MNLIKKILKGKSQGQSLLEAMIAISILTTGLLGVLGLLVQSFYLNRAAADNTTAAYLASEGIEIAKNLIDHDVFTGLASGGSPNWGTCFLPLFPGGYLLDYTTTTCPPPKANGPLQPLKYDSTTHLYGYSSGTNSKFTRVVKISFPSANEIDVQSIVTWSTGLITGQSLILDDHFYNWR